jgi:hypothetical protein
MLLAVLYFPVSGGRPAMPVPSPAAISLLLTSLVTTHCPLWGRHDLHVTIRSGERPEDTQDGGGSQPEERHGLAAEVGRISRRRKNPLRGVFG